MNTVTTSQKKLNKFITIFLLIVVSAFKLQAYPLSSTITSAGKPYSTVETNRIWLNVTGSNGAFSQTLFGFRSDATSGYDAGLDGAYMNNDQILYDNKNIQATETIISNLNISQQTIIVRVTTNDGISINKKWLYL